MLMETKDACVLFKALSDESRLKIVKALLKNKEICACKLLDVVNCSQPTLSHHMKVLIKSGLVCERKEWKWTHYSLDEKLKEELVSFLLQGK